MKFQYNHKIYCHETKDTLFIHVPNFNTLSIKEQRALVIDCILLFNNRSVESVYKQLAEKHAISREAFEQVVAMLAEHNILKPSCNDNEISSTLTDKDFLKHDRQIKFMSSLSGNRLSSAVAMQEKIKSLHVAILGLGGVGSYLAYGLAAMGVNKLTLIDHDSVELSNVSRQMLYNEHDVGKIKITVATEKLSVVNPEIRMRAFNVRIENVLQLEQLLEKDTDMLMVAADTPRGRLPYLVDAVCQHLNLPFMLGSPSNDNIFVGPLIVPSLTQKLAEIIPPLPSCEKETIRAINERFVASVIDPYNAIAGKMMLAEAIKYFTAFQKVSVLGKIIIMNTENWQLVE